MERGTTLHSKFTTLANGIHTEAIINEGYRPITPFGLFAVRPLGGELTCREPSSRRRFWSAPDRNYRLAYFLAGEANDVGGTDEGPIRTSTCWPHWETCTNMTVRMYANRKRWPLRGVRTTLSHAKSHTAECEHCEQPTAMVDRLEMQITFLGELSEEQRNRLLQIADRCPVHRTLASKIVIHTVLAATALE